VPVRAMNQFRGAGSNDGIVYALGFLFGVREAGERAFDAEADGGGAHTKEHGCRGLREQVAFPCACED